MANARSRSLNGSERQEQARDRSAVVPADDCNWRTCLDVIAWQRACDSREEARFVAELPSGSK